MTMSIKGFAAKYPTWDLFMSTINNPDVNASNEAAHDLGSLLGEDLTGMVGLIRGAGANRGAGGQYYQVYQDALTSKYYAVIRASHS